MLHCNFKAYCPIYMGAWLVILSCWGTGMGGCAFQWIKLYVKALSILHVVLQCHILYILCIQSFIQDRIFRQQGEIVASSNMLKLRDLGHVPPGKFWNLWHLRLFLVASETTFTNKKDRMLNIIMIAKSLCIFFVVHVNACIICHCRTLNRTCFPRPVSRG